MKLAYKSIVSAFLALCIVLTSTLVSTNAYADGLNGVGTSSTHFISTLNVKGNHNSITVNNSLGGEGVDGSYRVQSSPNQFADSISDGVIQTVGWAIGGLVACYAMDAVATTVFPPAATLAAFCPVVGAAGGGNAMVRGAQALAK